MRDSESQLLTIIENISEGLAVSNLEGQMLHFNRVAQELHGFATREECRRHLSEFAEIFELSSLDGAVLPLEQWPLSRILRGENLHNVEVNIRRLKSDWRRSFNFGGTLVRGTDGNPMFAVVTMSDITERKADEQRLREQAELLDKAREAIMVSNLDHRTIYWNRGAERIFGWTAAEVLGRNGTGTFTAEALARIESSRPSAAGDEWHGEVEVPDKHGRTLILDSSVTLIRDSKGRPKSHLIISTDITERKELEKRLLRAQRLESIGLLAGGIAHDLNNMLAPVLMSVNLLQQKVADAGVGRLLGVLETSAMHGADLIRQVLAFARGVEGDRGDIQPHLVIRDVAHLLGETLPRSIAIETDVTADLALIHSNSTNVGQVLMNLCVNARDAMPTGGVLKIDARNAVVDAALARAHPGAVPGDYVRITVTDTGTGIPPQILDRIFDPFFTTKAVGKGTGLGLSTVIGIVKSDGGFLEVESNVGRGTEFRLFFPAVLAARNAPERQNNGIPDRGGDETVLVIDDEESIRVVTQGLLNAAGYRVVLADDGRSGLATYRAHRDEIKVVLTDIMMPGMQGTQIVHELRAIDPDVRIVAMSGILREAAGISEEPGRMIFLQKPMTAAELFRAVQSVLPRS